jgi:hypothetical protein
MQRAVLDQILRGLDSIAVQGARMVVPDGLRVEILASAGHDVMAVGPARELVLSDLCAAITTDKDETYFLEYDRVTGVRIKGKPSARPVSRAGFTPD